MRELLLLRHAHAENAAPGQPDFERPLSPRGRAEALDAAYCIRAADLHCDALLVSPARRTRQTAGIIHDELTLAAQPHFDPELYLADAATLLRRIAAADPGSRALLLIAHNPGISELAQRLAPADPPHELRTSGLCVLRFDDDVADWSRIAEHSPGRVRMLR